MGRLHIGLGAVACCEGRYRDAKGQFQRAYEVFAGLGNDTYCGSAAAQMALCCMRLGEYAESIDWGNHAVRTFGPHFSGYQECLTALCLGCSYAMTGNYKGTTETISVLDSRIPQTAPAWMLQAWGLYKADIFLLAGQHSEAEESAQQALKEPPQLYSSFFAGPFSRWLALTSGVSLQEQQPRAEYITSLLEELDRYDSLDQAEILCASLVLDNRSEETPVRRCLLDRKLSRLPPAIADQLSRLGMSSRNLAHLL
jgi:tetratricopeptide (TPR) repeat protein